MWRRLGRKSTVASSQGAIVQRLVVYVRPVLNPSSQLIRCQFPRHVKSSIQVPNCVALTESILSLKRLLCVYELAVLCRPIANDAN